MWDQIDGHGISVIEKLGLEMKEAMSSPKYTIDNDESELVGLR